MAFSRQFDLYPSGSMQNLSRKQHMSTFRACAVSDDRAVLYATQEKPTTRTQTGLWISDFPVTNGNARQNLAAVQQTYDLSTHARFGGAFDFVSSTGFQTLSSGTPALPVGLANLQVSSAVSPMSHSSRDLKNMTEEKPKMHFAPDWETSVLGGPGDVLAVDSDLDSIEGQYEDPLTLSEIGPLPRVRGRNSDPTSASSPRARPLDTQAGGAELGSQAAGAIGGNALSPAQLNIETKRPKFQTYARFDQRLGSFADWHHACQEKERLAEAGFYYMGLADRVCCFYCGVALSNWHAEDVPWVEHARYKPSCPFVLWVKTPSFVSAVQSVARTSSPIRLCDVEKEMERSQPRNGNLDGSFENSAAIAVEDDVLEEMSPSEFQQRADELERENTSLRHVRMCKICMDKEVAVKFLPCGHLVSCGECAPAFKSCPMCRETVKGLFRVLMD